MNTRSKSTLFLIEQLIVIAVFALCAAACIAILAHSFFTAEETRDMSNALLRAENAAEAFKATGGDLDAVADIIGGEVFYDLLIVSYDSGWQLSDAYNAAYYLSILLLHESSASLVEGEIRVLKRPQNGYVIINDPYAESILSFPVVARSSMIGGGSR